MEQALLGARPVSVRIDPDVPLVECDAVLIERVVANLLENAAQAFRTFMTSLAAVFAAVFVVLNLMLSWLIIRPVSQMSDAADKISTGDFDQPEFPDDGRDEVAVLASAFNRMRRSLEKAMQMIDS